MPKSSCSKLTLQVISYFYQFNQTLERWHWLVFYYKRGEKQFTSQKKYIKLVSNKKQNSCQFQSIRRLKRDL